MICLPETTDWACAKPDWVDALTPEVKARSEALAWRTLAALTANQISTCPILVRPCKTGCRTGSWMEASVMGVGISGTVFTPGINNQGFWVNSCGCNTACGCGSIESITLEGPVGGIVEVRIDGVVVPPSAYRIDNFVELVRTDGGTWPSCQDMSLDNSEVGTFSVSYYLGAAPDGLMQSMAGMLAAEFAKACLNDKSCRLPTGTTSIVRQGVAMEIRSTMFEDGLTGIREVDSYVAALNPFKLKARPVVFSPDARKPRRTDWRG